MGRLKTSTDGLSITRVTNQLAKLPAVLGALDGVSLDGVTGKLTSLANAMAPLSQVQKATGLNNIFNTLRKLPEIVATLRPELLAEFGRQVNQLNASLQPLASTMDRVSAGFKVFPQRIQKTILANERLTASAKKVSNAKHGLAQSFVLATGKVALMIYTVKRITNVFKSAVSASNSYTETIAKSNILFGQYAREAGEYAKKVQDIMGIDMGEWLNNQSVFMSIFRGFGSASDDALRLSKSLTELAYDLSAFHNDDFEVAIMKVQAGITGQIKPLREYGIAVDNATLKEIARKNGITKSLNEMTQLEKAELRYWAMHEQAGRLGVFGQMARELQNPQAQLRILTQQAQILARNLGALLTPAFLGVVQAVRFVIGVLNQLIVTLLSLFKIEMPTLGGSGGGIGEIVDDVDDLDSGLAGATGRAKELKALLAGFDRLNVLNEDDRSSGASGGGGGGISGGGLGLELPEHTGFLDEAIRQSDEMIKKYTQSITDFISSIDWQPMSDGLSNVWDSMKPIISNLTSGLSYLATEVVAPLFRWFMESFAPAGLNVLAGALDVLNPLLESAGRLGAGLYENFLKPIASWTGGVIVDGLNALADALERVGVFFSENPDVADQFVLSLAGLGVALGALSLSNFQLPKLLIAGGTFSGFASALLSGFGTAFSTVASALAPLLTPIWTAISGWMGGLVGPVVAGIGGFLAPITGAVTGLFAPLIETLSGFLTPILTTLVAPFQGVVSAIATFVNPIWIVIGALLALGGAFVQIWTQSETFRDTVSEAISGIADTFQNLWDTVIEPVGSVIIDMFKDIWEIAIKPLWDGFVDMVESVSTAFLDLWNNDLKPVVDWFIDTFGPTLVDIINVVADAFSIALGFIGTYFGTAFEVIGELVSGILEIFGGIITFLSGVFTGDWEKAWEGVQEIFDGIWNTIGGIVETVWDGIVGLFSKGGEIFGGIVSGLGNIFRDIINLLLDGINAVIRAPFDVINGILNYIKNISILGFKPFSKLWGYNPIGVPQIPKIPAYEEGTNYVPQTGLAMLHKGETVIPKQGSPYQAENDDEMIILLSEQNELLMRLLDKDSNVYLNDRKVNEETQRTANRTSRRLGYVKN